MKDTEKKVVIDMHRHGFETGEYQKANLTPHQFLQANLAIAGINDFKFVINCGGHDSTLWGKEVWKVYKQNPKLAEYLDIKPESEFNVDIGKILTYDDQIVGDKKYVFKKIHMLAAAKKGKEEEFFERTRIYSTWSDMYIKRDLNSLVYTGDYPKNNDQLEKDYINIGEMMKAARNIICDLYCKNPDDRIPFDIYEDTIEKGLTYEEIRQRFLDDTFNYLVSKGLIKNTPQAKIKLSTDIESKRNFKNGKWQSESVFREFTQNDLQNAKKSKNPKGCLPPKIDHSFSRLQPEDIKVLFGDTAYLCVAHPNTLAIRNSTGLPVSVFDGIDISSLPKAVQYQINKKLSIYKETGKDYIFTVKDGTDVLYQLDDKKKHIVINGDISGLVKDEILVKYMDEYCQKFGFKIDAYEISPWMFGSKNENNNHQQFAWNHFDMYARRGKAVNCNSCLGDMHMNRQKDLSLIDETMSYAKGQRNYYGESTYVCTKCSWVDLIENGVIDAENQQLEVRVLKQKFSKNDAKKADKVDKTEKELNK